MKLLRNTNTCEEHCTTRNMVHVMVAHLNVNVKYLLGQHRIANGDTILLAAIQADDVNVLIV